MKHKYILLVFLMTLLAIHAAYAQDTPKVEYTVTADTANLRAGPGTNYAVAGTAVKGDSLLIYQEEPETSGWLRVYRSDEADAYVADFLVERAPMRFYPVDQEPILTASGRGSNITDVYDIPQGAYRIDAVIEDNAFILKSVTIAGDCKDRTLFNELNFDKNKLVMSTLFVSKGCSIIFGTENVDGAWEITLRDLLDVDFFLESLLQIKDGTTIAGSGKALTMPTRLEPGTWSISGMIQDRAFILHAHVLAGECDDTSVFNELDLDAKSLEISTVYRSAGEDGCIVYWETSNVDGDWEIAFTKLR